MFKIAIFESLCLVQIMPVYASQYVFVKEVLFLLFNIEVC